MKGRIYYNVLPYELRELFKQRFEEDSLLGDLDEYLNHDFDDMQSFIAGSFIWIGTPEGHDYWENLARRKWNVNQFMGRPILKHRL